MRSLTWDTFCQRAMGVFDAHLDFEALPTCRVGGWQIQIGRGSCQPLRAFYPMMGVPGLSDVLWWLFSGTLALEQTWPSYQAWYRKVRREPNADTEIAYRFW